MSNEELAARIQAGETNLMEDLWEQVAGLVKWAARRIMPALGNRGGVELDDLIQSGYLALVAAVASYAPDNGSFSSWLMYYLKTAFAQASGYRTEKQRNDPLRFAVSLEAPLGDEDGNTVGDLQADPTSAAPFEAVEERVFREQLRQVLDSVLDQLPPQQAQTIRGRYFDGSTLDELAADMGKSLERIRQLEANGLDRLREPQLRKQLEDFLEIRTPYFLHVGPTAFHRTGESSVEKIVFLRERLRARIRGLDNDERTIDTLHRAVPENQTPMR